MYKYLNEVKWAVVRLSFIFQMLRLLGWNWMESLKTMDLSSTWGRCFPKFIPFLDICLGVQSWKMRDFMHNSWIVAAKKWEWNQTTTGWWNNPQFWIWHYDDPNVFHCFGVQYGFWMVSNKIVLGEYQLTDWPHLQLQDFQISVCSKCPTIKISTHPVS